MGTKTPACIPMLGYDSSGGNGCAASRDLDKRITVVETHLGYIQEDIQDNKQSLFRIADSVSIVERYMNELHGTFPKIEETLSKVVAQQATSERTILSMGLKQKIIWGSVVAVAATVGGAFLKFLIGLVI